MYYLRLLKTKWSKFGSGMKATLVMVGGFIAVMLALTSLVVLPVVFLLLFALGFVITVVTVTWRIIKEAFDNGGF